MPFAYTIDVDRSLVLSRAWGVLNDGDLLAHTQAYTVDPRFEPHFGQLADLREVSGVTASRASVREIAQRIPFTSTSRRALVVSTDVAYGVARMYQILGAESPDQLEVFRDLDEAVQWLGVAEVKAELLLALSEAKEIPVTP